MLRESLSEVLLQVREPWGWWGGVGGGGGGGLSTLKLKPKTNHCGSVPSSLILQ